MLIINILESFSFWVVNKAAGNQKYENHDYTGKGKVDLKKNNLVCPYCKKLGHTIDKCYRIVGLSDFKFTRSKKIQGATHSNAVITEPPSFTRFLCTWNKWKSAALTRTVHSTSTYSPTSENLPIRGYTLRCYCQQCCVFWYN